ncbi:MAG: hypothetical protein II238_00505 [Alphaproteobacteria bacterium]|nr:hypothetical protein [Alphaproteobacteria bacterium]
MKDFIDDIKDAFDVLPKVLSIAIIMGFIAMFFFGLDGFISFFVGILGIWALIFILLPLVVLILDCTNHVLDPEKSKKK